MCGFCGVLTPDGAAVRDEFGSAVDRMADRLVRRGPDDAGAWAEPHGRLRLGFRRLAVLDPTPAGHQPMVSGSGRSVIAFNGEIYNFPELRAELEARGIRFRTRTDTEVLLEALEHWGEAVIPRLNGMFAFAWYHLDERRLVLARDHAGIKPLYYFVHPHGEGMAFASQFDCLLDTPWGEPGPLRGDVLHLYLRLHHIPPPFALLENTHQLEPGHYLVLDGAGRLRKQAWWTMPRDPEPDLSGERAVDALAEALYNSIRRQRVADVPLGVFLSGGIDSPLVTAIARAQTDPSLKAFTIGNPGWGQDEAELAAVFARHLDVNHRLHAADGTEAAMMIRDVIAAQHEPFADFSILPTLLVSRAARSEVTVALSGDGGDELFFGYERPLSLLRNGRDFRFPRLLRMALYGAGRYGVGARRSEAIVAPTPGHYYFGVNSRLGGADLRAIAPDLPDMPADFGLYRFEGYRGTRHLANYSRWVEFYGQLQRGLKKVDMASMHHSLEVRVPLLDREVIDVALRVDPFTCMRDGTRKAVLRDLLGRYVPPQAIPTRKLGFAVPLGEWLRGPLRPLVEDTLFSTDGATAGLFERRALRSYWDDHLSGRKDRKWGLWTILALNWWTVGRRDNNERDTYGTARVAASPCLSG
jgi:asparagine synthase (glutamine-hydrolysing)